MALSAPRGGPGRSTEDSRQGGFPCGSRWRERGPTRQRGPGGARCKGSTVCPTETGGTIALRPPRRSRVRWGTSPPVREAGPAPHRRARTRTRGGSSSPREGGRRSTLGLPVRFPFPSPTVESPHDPRPPTPRGLGSRESIGSKCAVGAEGESATAVRLDPLRESEGGPTLWVNRWFREGCGSSLPKGVLAAGRNRRAGQLPLLFGRSAGSTSRV